MQVNGAVMKWMQINVVQANLMTVSRLPVASRLQVYIFHTQQTVQVHWYNIHIAYLCCFILTITICTFIVSSSLFEKKTFDLQ